jgi:hypothetical protein
VRMRLSVCVRSLAVLILLFAAARPAAAQATRTWVSGVGDDANPCSRIAPCKTFAGAISKTAAGGEIDALDPGGFGAVTITKGITIDGGGGQVASVLVAGTNGINVQAGANDVVILRNIRINGINVNGNGGLHGIHFTAGRALIVEHCDIFGFTLNGIDVALNQGTDGNVLVTDTVITNCSQNGLRATNAGAAFVRVTLTRDVFDLNGFGVTATDNSLVLAADSHVAHSALNGWFAFPLAGGPAQITLTHCTSSNNGGAGAAAQNPTGIVRFDGSIMDHNAGAGIVSVAGGQLLTFSNNRSIANGGGDGAATGAAVTVF